MTLPQNYMPYAPAARVLDVIRRARDGKLQEQYTLDQLVRLGTAEGNADRVQKALEFLALVDGDTAQRTPSFERLSRVTSEEYPRAVAEIVQNAYAPVLAVVDPQEATDVALHDAFRGYDPAGQRPRMVGLFLALCREAGLVAGGPVEGQRAHVRPRGAGRATTPPRQRIPAAGRRQQEQQQTSPQPNGSGQPEGDTPDYRLLGEIIRQLPREGRWTIARRNRWISAVTATVDLLVAIDDEGGGP